MAQMVSVESFQSLYDITVFLPFGSGAHPSASIWDEGSAPHLAQITLSEGL